MRAVEEAAAAVLDGRLIVLPTDTVYGLAARPDDGAATDRLFEAKRRPRHLDLPVLVPTLEAAREVASFDQRADRLAGRHWPGPLTIVLPRAAASRGWNLGAEPHTIGVRVPRDLLALAVLERTGPLAVTSANLSGDPTPSTCEELAELFGEAVAVYLCRDRPLAGLPSTVIDLTGATPRVLRAGAISEGELAAELGSR